MLLKSGLFFTLCLFTLQASQIKGKNPVGRLGLLLTCTWDFSFCYCLGIMIAQRDAAGLLWEGLTHCPHYFKFSWWQFILWCEDLSAGFLSVRFHCMTGDLKETVIHFKGNRVFQLEVCIWLCHLKTSLCKLQNARSSSNRSLIFRKMSSKPLLRSRIFTVNETGRDV